MESGINNSIILPQNIEEWLDFRNILRPSLWSQLNRPDSILDIAESYRFPLYHQSWWQLSLKAVHRFLKEFTDTRAWRGWSVDINLACLHCAVYVLHLLTVYISRNRIIQPARDGIFSGSQQPTSRKGAVESNRPNEQQYRYSRLARAITEGSGTKD